VEGRGDSKPLLTAENAEKCRKCRKMQKNVEQIWGGHIDPPIKKKRTHKK